jgi:hypothetical protein
MNKHLLKNIWAVVAGILVVVVLSIGTDTFLESVGIFPSPTAGLFDPKLLLLALAYRTLYAFAGGYVTARLAPKNPQRLVIILLVIGTLMGLMGVVAGWNLSEKWYPISLVFTSALGVWFGGKFGISSIHDRKKKK